MAFRAQFGQRSDEGSDENDTVFPGTQPGFSEFSFFDWYPSFISCVRYFVDVAQYESSVQGLASFINILLPYQKTRPVLFSRAPSPNAVAGPASPAAPPGLNPLLNSQASQQTRHAAAVDLGGPPGLLPPPSRTHINPYHRHPHPHNPPPLPHQQHLPAAPVAGLAYVPLLPYIRRLVATGFDQPAMLHGWFGDDWAAGIGPLHEQERRNYLFAAKSDSWLTVKRDYDMDEDQTVPFLRPLQGVSEEEIRAAEEGWSSWLAMQDWMLGPMAPEETSAGTPKTRSSSPQRQQERQQQNRFQRPGREKGSEGLDYYGRGRHEQLKGK